MENFDQPPAGNETRALIFDFTSAVAGAQQSSDTTFKPEAQRLSLMYSEAGMLGNLSIVDFNSANQTIGLDTDRDGTADEYENREQFMSDSRINTGNTSVEAGNVIKIDNSDGTHSELGLDGTIKVLDANNKLTELKTMQSVSDIAYGARAVYEDIKFDWDGDTASKQGPSATITDAHGRTERGLLAVNSAGEFMINVAGNRRIFDSDGRVSRLISRDLWLGEFKYESNTEILNASSHRFDLQQPTGVIVSTATAHVGSLVQVPLRDNTMVVPGDISPGEKSVPVRGVNINADNTVDSKLFGLPTPPMSA